MSFHPSKALRKRFRVAVLASGADLGAATDGFQVASVHSILELSAIILLQTFESAQCCTSELHSRDYKHGHDEKIVPADIRVGFSPATSPLSFCRMADRYSEAFPCSARTPLLRTGERQCRCFQLLSTGRANPGNRGTRPLLLTSGVSNELEGDWHPYAELAGPRSRCIDLKAGGSS